MQDGQQVGVHFVDDHAPAALGERHRHRRLGHAVGGDDRLGLQPERRPGVAEVLDVERVHLLGARQRPPQRRQVELPGCGLPAQPLGEQVVGKVRRGRHGALVLVNQLGPQQRIAQEVHRRDLHQLGADVHRHRQVARHAHVVEARQPAHDHVGVEVEVAADHHGLGVGDDIGVRDLNGLRRSGRARCQLHQRHVVVAGVDGPDRGVREQRLDGQHRHTEPRQHRRGGHERVGDDDGFRRDHVDDAGGLFGPAHQVGAGSGLMHHGQAGAAHPDALGGRRDLDRGAGQHRDGVTVSDARRGQPTGHPASSLVHFGPGMPDGRVRLPGDHALETPPGVAVHRLGKSAHDNPFGLGEITTRVCCVGNPARNFGRARNFGSRWGSTVVEPCRASMMSREVRDSFLFTPDSLSLRPKRHAVHVRRTDCTDPTRRAHRSAPMPARIVTIAAEPAGTEPPSPKAQP